MRKTLRQIITTVLAAAILITGSSFCGTVTANATTINGQEITKFKPDGTMTLKLGDTKRLALIGTTSDGKEMNVTSQFTWTSSNETVVSIIKMDPLFDSPDYFKIYVSGKGTAVITGTPVNPANRTMQMTITVEGSKMTKAQKNCKKHVWKVTKKATCKRTGIKTCTKCKLQKSIAKTSHKYETVTCTEQVDDEVYVILTCTRSSCGHMDTCPTNPDPGHAVCAHFCGYQIDSRDYPSVDAAIDAMRAHQMTDCKRDNEDDLVDNAFKGGTYDDTTVHIGHLEDYTVKQCKYCGKEKKGTKKVIKVHTEVVQY